MNSKKEIVLAGKVLRERLSMDSISDIESKYDCSVYDAFRIAHDWRDAHMFPLLRVRMELARRLGTIEKGAVTAARVKRMESIRRKLQRPITLYQMQDIAGCRAIVRSMKEVDRIAGYYASGSSQHVVQKEDNYISNPKNDGYRSRHIILKYSGNDERYNRQTVEIQLRTRIQHAWSTAVESVGLIRGENIKGGEGDDDWRRFFVLMSTEFSYEEGSPLPSVCSLSREEVRKEIKDLSKRIKAVSTLEKYKQAIKYADWYEHPGARYYLLQFDNETKGINVRAFFNYEDGASVYVEQERSNKKANTVLVEVNKVNDLKKAFPNYFLDVSAFTEKLKSILMPNYRSGVAFDLSWLATYR